MVAEYIAEARCHGEDFVVRAQPKGFPKGVAGLSESVVFLAELRRWIRRDKHWIVQVRVRREDPFGEVRYEETVADEVAARERVEGLGGELRSGKPPWEHVEEL